MIHQRHDHNGFDLRTSFNLLYFGIDSYSKCFTVFSRRYFGGEALGFSSLAALGIMLVYAAHNPASNGMRLFIPMWMFMLVVQRVGTRLAGWRGMTIHSRYVGQPWLGLAFPFVRTELAARWMEALSFFAIGTFLGEYDLALGQFVLFGCFGLVVKNAMDLEIDRKLLVRMHDAEIEQQHLMELRSRRHV